MTAITLAGFLVCRSLEEADRAALLLPEHIRLTRAEPGCLRFDVIRSMADPLRFAVFETFADRAAFDLHQTRTRASPWWQASRHIPRDYKIEEGPLRIRRAAD
jgi:quinol monooxygenase YgiN